MFGGEGQKLVERLLEELAPIVLRELGDDWELAISAPPYSERLWCLRIRRFRPGEKTMENLLERRKGWFSHPGSDDELVAAMRAAIERTAEEVRRGNG